MKQKFFTRTIQSDFIKSLLYNTPLPVYNTCRVGDYLIKGTTYIYNRQVIKCTSSGYLCNNFKILQSWTFNPDSTDPIIPLVTRGCVMENLKYYLLGEYNLRYNLEDDDPDYPIFNSSNNYLTGDIVRYYSGSDYLLYEAKQNIPANTAWNYNNWNYLKVCSRPYVLIQCTKSGILGARPKNGSAYRVLQTFEPLELSSNDTRQLDRHTYYIITSLLENNNVAKLIYNEDLNHIDQIAATWRSVGSYIPEQYYTKYCNRFISNLNYYDSETHVRLGKLLRFYRDLYNLDLMQYYNCWDGSNLIGYQIFNNELVETSSDQYKLIKVPIKFNKKYTVAIDSPTIVKLVPCIMNLNKFITVQVGTSNPIVLNNLLDDSSIKVYNSLRFNNPIVFELDNKSTALLHDVEPSVRNLDLLKAEFLQRYENNLYLIIQLEKTVTSSIVILEGDYTAEGIRKYFNEDNLNQIRLSTLNELLTSNLSLLQLNDQSTYPFADRLIEYLLYNVITQVDPITENSERVRKKLEQSFQMWDPNEISWTDYLRILIFNILIDSDKQGLKLDISGYVDRDAEYFIDTNF